MSNFSRSCQFRLSFRHRQFFIIIADKKTLIYKTECMILVKIGLQLKAKSRPNLSVSQTGHETGRV